MTPQNDSFISRFPHSLSDQVQRNPSAESCEAAGRAHAGKGRYRCLALILVLAACPSTASKLLSAQEAPDPWPTDDPTEGTYSSPSQPDQYGYAQPQQAYPQPQVLQQPRGFSADQLEQMVAPIALSPDNLVSIVLAAATYPAEVAAADQWLHMQGNTPPEQIAAGADEQTSWDPSVKALTAFPQVLDQLAQNLQWAIDLGNAYYNQPQDVMQTIQVMRSRAQAAGTLQSSPQEQVTIDQGSIVLAPPDPQVVYVPAYNPWVVYGAPVLQYPGYDWVGAAGSFMEWGPGIGVQAFAVVPFGWFGWGVDWFAHAVIFNHSDYCTHSYQVRDWGFAHGGPRGFRGWERAGFRDGRGWGRQDFLRASYNHGYGQGYGRFGSSQIAHGTFNRGGQNWGQGGGISRGDQRFGNDRIGSGYRGFGNTYGRSGLSQQGGGQSQNYGGRTALSYSGRPQSGAMRNYGSVYGSGHRGSFYGSSYGSNMYSRSPQAGSGRYGSGYSSPAYRSPMPPAGGYRSAQPAYGGSSFARNEHVAGGSHLFGGGNQSSGFNYYGGSYKAPSSSGFGGGHSGWGGSNHFDGGGYRAPHLSGGGGGGHFGGGGHSGGVSHSSGGHGGHH